MTEPDPTIDADDELSDGTEITSFRLAPIDVALLTNSVVLAAFGGVAVGMALLVWPERSDRILARIIGVGLVWLALTGLRAITQRRSLDVRSLLGPLVTAGVGAMLLIAPDQSTVFIGRVIGILLLVYVARSVVEQVGRDERDWSRIPLLAVVAAIGFLTIIVTGEVFATIIAIGAVILVAVSVLVLVVSLDSRTDGVAGYDDTTALVVGWLRERPKSLDARQGLYDKILYEGPTTRTRVIRFFALMGFASVIASMGVITDSTAVVIGAMLVAPLMTPLMGMAISLVMGWPNRLLRASGIAIGGILFAIGIGVLLGLVAPADIDTAVNSQIVARTSPTVLDLVVAVAAGGAGAYGLSRPDVSDALPGVAIAISLVPPLTVVGIAFSQGDVDGGGGALLLFCTNMIAILIVGGLTFVLTGVTPIDHAASSGDRVRTGLGVTFTVAVLVVGGLLLNGAQITTDALRDDRVTDTIEAWIPDDSGHRLVRSDIDDQLVSAIVVGPADGLPDVEELAENLRNEFGETITVDISLVVEERLQATSSR